MAYRLAVLFSSLFVIRGRRILRCACGAGCAAGFSAGFAAGRSAGFAAGRRAVARAPVSRLDVLPVLALVWLQDVGNALPAFQVERAESGLTQAVPAPVSPLAAQLPAFPLAWHSVFRLASYQDGRPVLAGGCAGVGLLLAGAAAGLSAGLRIGLLFGRAPGRVTGAVAGCAGAGFAGAGDA